MNDVKVHRQTLLVKLKENRDAHRGLFLKAQDGFRARVIEELDGMLAAARRGERVRLTVGLVEPQDHTKEYDRAIAMLEWSVEAEVAIDQHAFQSFVLDEWAWTAQAHAVNTTYSRGGKMERL